MEWGCLLPFGSCLDTFLRITFPFECIFTALLAFVTFGRSVHCVLVCAVVLSWLCAGGAGGEPGPHRGLLLFNSILNAIDWW